MHRNLPARIQDGLLFGEDIDNSLEQCEDLLIEATRRAPSDKTTGLHQALFDHVAGDLEDQLDRLVLFEDLAEGLREWTEPREYESGATLIGPGLAPEGLQLLTYGRASAYDSREVRLHQYVAGDALEPGAAFGPCSPDVSVIADEPCRTLTLTPEAPPTAGNRRTTIDHPPLRLLAQCQAQGRSGVGAVVGPPHRLTENLAAYSALRIPRSLAPFPRDREQL